MENQAIAPRGEADEQNPNNRTDLINTFSDITSASKEEAIFFLESHNFDLDSAVSTFFETNSTLPVDADVAAPVNLSQGSSPSRSRSRSPSPSPPVVLQPNPYNTRSRQAPAPSGNPADKKPSGSRAGGIRTLSDLNRRTRDDSGSDSDEPQEYYTGGEKSGMLVQDPSKVNNVDALFNQARQAGAVEGPADHHLPSSSSSRSFRGTARTLAGETLSSAPQPPEVVMHNITFWTNGFTVDDGPLRMLDDPQNASFLESIRKSECPKELEPADRKTSVHVSLTRREENCPVPQKSQVSFQGVGRTLGSPTTAAPAEPTAPNTVPLPTMGLVVEETLPSTSIQLRLADGTRMVSRFNYNHTIRDIRGFIDASRPGGPRTYQLQTVGFPPKQLTDMDQTIEQAGLANSVVIQKL